LPRAARVHARTVTEAPSTGFAAIDQLLGGVRIGDNVVWRLHGASREPFTASFLRTGAALPKLAYVSFDASAAEVLAQYGREAFPDPSVLLDCSSRGSRRTDGRATRSGGPSVRVVEDPGNVLAVTAALVAIERELGTGTRYVFDNLTTIQKTWGREAALALFLEHCPRLFHLETVAYWFLDADEHDQSFLERMTQLTQVVLDVEPSSDGVLVAVAKAQGRTGSPGKRAHISLPGGTGTIVDAEGGNRGSSGERLRQMRIDKGLSQATLARQAGITPSALSQAERGVSALSQETLVRLWRSLGIDVGGPEPAGVTPYRVWRRGERRRRQLAPGLEAETVLTDDAGLSVHSLQVAAKAAGKRPPFPTKRPEAVLIESGVLEVKVNDATEVLHAGDALLLKDDSVSSWRNPGLSEARVVWIIFPVR
jgi:transcriptional regulator with XRE-family HTH domain